LFALISTAGADDAPAAAIPIGKYVRVGTPVTEQVTRNVRNEAIALQEAVA